MKIDIESTNAISKYYLLDLAGKKIHFRFGQEFETQHDWYELRIPYDGVKNEFSKLSLNGVDLGELMYTGYYTDGSGSRHQPATAVWDEGGYFTIWLHSDIGVFMERIMRCLRSGDYGKNLFETYTLTIDRPFAVNDDYPIEIKSFFNTAYGPYWWRHDSEQLPYKILPKPELDKNSVIDECRIFCRYEKKYTSKNTRQEYLVQSSHPECIFDLPFTDVDKTRFPNLSRLLDKIGIKRPLSIGLNTLNPGKHFHIHRDSNNYTREGYKYVKGCRIFYWLLTDPDEVFYKFGRCGLLPIHRPLLINPIEHVHSVVNQSDRPRLVISIAGEFYSDK